MDSIRNLLARKKTIISVDLIFENLSSTIHTVIVTIGNSNRVIGIEKIPSNSDTCRHRIRLHNATVDVILNILLGGSRPLCITSDVRPETSPILHDVLTGNASLHSLPNSQRTGGNRLLLLATMLADNTLIQRLLESSRRNSLTKRTSKINLASHSIQNFFANFRPAAVSGQQIIRRKINRVISRRNVVYILSI